MDGSTLLSQMCLLRDFRSKRGSSWDRTGGNRDWVTIEAGATQVLLAEPGAGCVRHFYWTYIEDREQRRLNVFRGLVLRAFWDGEETPSVEAPLGDFFGVTNGMVRPIRSLAFTTNPGGQGTFRSWGFNCYLPMPFASGGRIEIENQGPTPAGIWYHVDYELYDEASALPADAGRLHAQWRREPRTDPIAVLAGQDEIKNLTGEENYTILEAAGDGQFAGYFLTVVNGRRSWWGEGDDMIFIDGEPWPPSIHGTGTEEIFGGGACPAVEYSGPYTGFHCIENRAGYPWWGTNGMYRFHLTDPIRFRKSIRVTIEHGHGNDLANDYSSTAFWYQKEPHGRLPRLPGPGERKVNFQE
ncbi:MAG: hypothetical protein AMJ81_01405 [Phycisphaerae bacterium SM23_33]|nr:MAG: hypothetical protein AMJ81_01405 [Phycisphaerae bacterium SM23_33]